MKIALHCNNSAHQKTHVAWMAEGLKQHGVECVLAGYDEPVDCDVAVVWGWKQRKIIVQAKRVLVMERGHVGDRMTFTSMGWGGLGGRAKYPCIDDGGARWREHFDGLMKEWQPGGGSALICGQCDGDASLLGLDFRQWAEGITAALLKRGERVVYRPHPTMLRSNYRWCPVGAEFSERSLADDLKSAAFVVTYNSTAGVDAVLAGAATITRDQGAMAWPVTSHSLDEPLVRPDRSAWAHQMAWSQWLPDEISSGVAWAAVSEVMQ